jgi:cysteine-rich repeat protein
MSSAIPLVLAMLGSACTRPNPGFGAETDAESGTGDTADTQDVDSDSVGTTMTSSASTSASSTDPSGVDSSESGGDAVCGNGVREDDEECDKGEETDDSRACTSTCRHSRCGDGLVGPGEGCDDQNDVDDDDCSNACIARSCGNGVVDEDMDEPCDPSAPIGGVLCTPACTINECHDGYQLGIEDCDDGNTDDTDGCVADCKIASCGDTFVHEGVEVCDDGNDENTDACVQCLEASCGDGFVHAGDEQCDPEAESSFACASNGFFAGEGNCTSECEIDLSSCTNCGDGQPDEGEACDFGEDDIVIVCPEGNVWVGEGSLGCNECQFAPEGECCMLAGQPCNPDAPTDPCCGQCNDKTSICQGG